ncbi:MAG: hypothetical protein OXO49_09035 [Gammaproteobacteria bacterium]|nr:hypothetical protein [Gammaproteobacteria bacterium]MDE0252568.1 hypothetical protein [Gammaproteobacteria bacterium]MDE0403529.1 hypothetical protein [Gammaproteobacteria bacterium]
MGKEASIGDNAVGQQETTMEQLVRGCCSFFKRLCKAYPKAPQSRDSLVDCLGTALSMFVLKYPSRYRYLQDLGQVQDEFTAPYAQAFRRHALQNIRHLFGVERVPTDTTIRRRVDEVRTPDLLGLFRVLTAWITKHRLWSKLQTSEGRLLVALDGT